MKKQIIKIFLALVLLTIAGSCKKFVDVGQPKNQLLSSEVFADSTNVNSALAGIYYSAITTTLSLNSGGLTLYPGLSADELVPTGNNSTVVQFYQNNIPTDSSPDNALWTAGFNFIYSANAIIEGVTKSNGIPAGAKLRSIAEARFVRGYEYFCLMNLYGPVPLVTSTDYKTNALLPRATADQLYTQIVADLQFAEANLGNNTGANDRPNALTASAVLAKVYLYQNKNDLAAAEASKVINSGTFSLETDPNNVFLTGSAETIWQLDLPFNKYTWLGQAFVPTSTRAVPKYILNPALVNSFEPGDIRLADWVKTNVSGTKSYSYPYKYKNNVLAQSATEGYILMRLAEVYLIRAEAEINSGNLTDGAADLNLIRARAGLSNTEAADAASLLTALQNERQHELFCEEGNRWFDLKRWELVNTILGAEKPSWTNTAQLYPVPISQIKADPNLTQNAGY
jgi:hypothetical protein